MKKIIEDTKRRARLAERVEEQKSLQEEIKNLERRERRQRQEIFDMEGEIEWKRDQLIETLVHLLFRVRWELA
jgi:hypothetical protein